MPEITLEYDAALQPSIDAFLSGQLKQQTNPKTGVVHMVPRYEDFAELVNEQVTMLLNGIVTQFPTTEVRLKMDAAQAAQQELSRMVAPAVKRPAKNQ